MLPIRIWIAPILSKTYSRAYNNYMDLIQVRLFKNRPPENAIVEDITNYLVVFFPAMSDYRRITFGLNLTDFKVTMPEEFSIPGNFPTGDKPTYMAIKPQTGGDYLFYFVEKFERVSNTVARITAKMDVLNTYFRKKEEYTATPDIWKAISPKSRISRRLVDRYENFETQNGDPLPSKIDSAPEGINPTLYFGKGGYLWKQTLIPEDDLYGDKEQPDGWVLAVVQLDAKDPLPTFLLLPRWEKLDRRDDNGWANNAIALEPQFENLQQYTGRHEMMSYNSLNLVSTLIIAVYSIPDIPDNWANIKKGVESYSPSNNWKAVMVGKDICIPSSTGQSDVDTAIALNVNALQTYGDEKTLRVHNQPMYGLVHALRADTKTSDFNKTVIMGSFYNPITANRSPNQTRLHFDPKERASEFYQPTFVYDTSSRVLQLEDYSLYKGFTPTFSLECVYSADASGQYYFNINSSGISHNRSTEVFYTILESQRGNKETQYSSDYIYYMRNGYNYDVKQKNLQDASSWISTGAHLIGSVASLATGNPIGVGLGISAATNAVTSLSSAIIGGIQRQDALDQKKKELAAHGLSVKNISANDLFRRYQGQDAPIAEIAEPRPEISAMLDDLFFYYGYSRSESLGSVADSFEDFRTTAMRSRHWFDYVEMSIEWLASAYYLDKDILNEISAKFAAGFTIFHLADDGTNDTYDFAQHYENWEVWAV